MSGKTLIIAEVGSNHGGSFATARRLIDAAARAGADAVKFQLYTADGLCHPSHPSYEAVRRTVLPREWVQHLAEFARTCGIQWSATPCDFAAVDLLDSLDVPFIKIASGDLTNLPLIRYAAQTGRHLIISTGMGTWPEVDAALTTALRSSPNQHRQIVTLLRCTVAYPSSIDDTHLREMQWLGALYEQRRWARVGISDHTTSIHLPALAVAAGAVTVEKHLTLSRAACTPDAPHSLEPDQFAEMVRGIREAERAIGEANPQRPLDNERPYLLTARRGLYYAADLPAGHVLTEADLTAVRPAHQVNPPDLPQVLGRTLTQAVRRWDAVGWGHVKGAE